MAQKLKFREYHYKYDNSTYENITKQFVLLAEPAPFASYLVEVQKLLCNVDMIEHYTVKVCVANYVFYKVRKAYPPKYLAD